MSATKPTSLSWVLLVSFAALAAGLAQSSSLKVTKLRPGTQLRGRSWSAHDEQPAPIDLAIAFQTITRSAPGDSDEALRDAVADRVAAQAK